MTSELEKAVKALETPRRRWVKRDDVLAIIRQHTNPLPDEMVDEEDAICKACATYACASASGGVDPDAMRQALACYKRLSTPSKEPVT